MKTVLIRAHFSSRQEDAVCSNPHPFLLKYVSWPTLYKNRRTKYNTWTNTGLILSKVVDWRQKLLPTWLVLAGYSTWHFFTDGISCPRLAAYFDNSAVYFKTFWQPWNKRRLNYLPFLHWGDWYSSSPVQFWFHRCYPYTTCWPPDFFHSFNKVCCLISF